MKHRMVLPFSFASRAASAAAPPGAPAGRATRPGGRSALRPAVVGAILIAFALFCLLMMAQLARAQTHIACAPLPDMLERLRQEFAEHQIVRFGGGQGEFVLTRADDGSWTLVRVIGETGCIVAAGAKSIIDRGV